MPHTEIREKNKGSRLRSQQMEKALVRGVKFNLDGDKL